MNVVDTYKKSVSTLNNEQAAYILGIFFLLALGLLNSIVPFPSYWVGFGFFVYGLAVWIHQTANTLSSVLYARALGAFLLLGVTTFNLAFASSSVHSILEVPTSAFRYTTTLVSVMLMPLSISLMLTFIAIPLIPIAMLNSILSLQNVSAKNLLSLKMFSSTKELSITLMFGRVFACITIFYIASSFLSDNTWYSDRIEGITKSFAYSFEMEQHSYCKLEQNQKVAYLNNELVIIGTENDGSYLFSISRCEVEL
ncbi:TPA: hypothetical protein NG611_004566 [Vibrio parahaemolyticus]|nr:hypothetical protein [Vibrio parahaemolyticus]HCE3433848.1 hypothetical protein [Vibrio parahaemolyticus]HCG7278438.1 hypothetical protein [Vibrio parahaemolyticus]